MPISLRVLKKNKRAIDKICGAVVYLSKDMRQNLLKALLVSGAIVICLADTYALTPAFRNGDYDTSPVTGLQCTNLQNNLRLRSLDSSTNFEVSKLQDFLQERGYLNTETTGYFGKLTQNAVKSYQSSKNLYPTGYVGYYTRSAIQIDSCSSLPPVCTTEARLCVDGSIMPRDSDCTWRPDMCNRSTLDNYYIDLNVHSSNLNRNLIKINNSTYYDATGVDGDTRFTISTKSINAQCVTYFKGGALNEYVRVSNSKSFSQSFNKDNTGLDYYKVSCGDDINYKKVETIFILETRADAPAICSLSSTYENKKSCICQAGYVKILVNTSWAYLPQYECQPLIDGRYRGQ